MGSFFISTPSSITNAVLAIFLELFVVLLGQDVYYEAVNYLCRRSLMKGTSVRLYGRAKHAVFVVCILSILGLCVLVELGIDGQVNPNARLETRSIQPKRSVLLTEVSNWTEHEQLEKHPSELTISDFPLSRRKGMDCMGEQVYYSQATDFSMFGDDECFNSTFARFSHLTSVRSLRNGFSNTHSPRLGERIDTNFSSQFGTLSFSEERAGRKETVLQLSVSFKAIRSDDRSDERGVVTFSVLKNWNYSSTASNCSTMDTIVSIFHGGVDFSTIPSYYWDEFRLAMIVQIFCFTDVFQPAVVNDVTDLVPRPNVTSRPFYTLRTFSLRPENMFDPNELVVVSDDYKLTTHKLFYALSRLHFVRENILAQNIDYLPYLVSQIDNRLSTQPDPNVTLRFHRPDEVPTLTAVKFTSLVCLFLAPFLFVVVKITFIRLRRKAPFQVRVFDAQYIASLPIYDEKTIQFYENDSQPEFQVYIAFEQDNGAVLRARRKSDKLEYQSSHSENSYCAS